MSFQSFDQGYLIGFELHALRDLIAQIRDWLRANRQNLFIPTINEYISGSPYQGDQIVLLGYQDPPWQYTVYQNFVGIGFGLLSAEQVFDDLVFGELSFATTDVPMFRFLEDVIRNTVNAWANGDPDHPNAVASHVELGVQSPTEWYIDITIPAQSGGHWPSGYNQTIFKSFSNLEDSPGAAALEVAASSEYFIALFEDADGKPGKMPFHAGSVTMALEVANSAAAKSDARWVGLRRITQLNIGPVLIQGQLVGDKFRLPAAQGSDVARKGKTVYNTAHPAEKASFEIPSVKASFLSKGHRTSTTDPLADGNTSRLLSSDGTSASSLRSAHYVPRKRR